MDLGQIIDDAILDAQAVVAVGGHPKEHAKRRREATNVILRAIRDRGTFAERASYKPTNHDNITNWPIIDRPVYFILEEELK